MQGGRARLYSWWQQIKQHRVAIEVAGIVLVVVIALIIAGYWFDWTGFNGYNKVTIGLLVRNGRKDTMYHITTVVIMNDVALEALVPIMKPLFEASDSGRTGDAYKRKMALY